MMIMRVALTACAVMSLAASALAAEEPLKVRFTWKIKGEYAPLYVAQDKGLFTKYGLAVTMAEGAGGQAAMGALVQVRCSSSYVHQVADSPLHPHHLHLLPPPPPLLTESCPMFSPYSSR